MWYPAQTSMMPVHVALARFLESRGWQGIFENYPYWYLGSTPFRYLTGPVLPGMLAIFHKIFPQFSLFEIMFGLVGIFWVIGGVGVYQLIRELTDWGDKGNKEDRGTAFLAAVFYLFGPIAPLMFRFSDGLSLIGFSMVPWVLLRYFKVIKGDTPLRPASLFELRRDYAGAQRKDEILFCSLTSFLLLLDISILPSLLLGMAAVLLAVSGWKRIEKKIKKSFLLLAFSFVLVTWWYTPGYFWQVLLAPSFAGKPLFKVIGQVSQLLPIALAIGLAIISASKLKKKISLNTKYNILYTFTFYWLFIFGFLTLIRFISDWDFWMDWTAYGSELQLGLAVLCGLVVSKWLRRQMILLFTIYCLLFILIFKRYILGTLQRDIVNSVEYKIGSQLSKIAKPQEAVFLSGSTVFWLNSFFDIAQVRGGSDLASVHPDWRKAAWEIREGKDVQKSLKWLKELGVSYLVAHTENSEEFYHDFKHPEKFKGVRKLKKIYDRQGDRIYTLKD